MKKLLLLTFALVALLTIAACSPEEQEPAQEIVIDDDPEGGEQDIFDPDGFDEPELVDLPDVVATVNDEDIYASDVEAIQAEFRAQNFDASVEEAVSELISKKLIAQEAIDRGYEVSTEEVEEIFEAQGHDLQELELAVEADGLDYSDFLESQFDDLLFIKLLEDEMEQIDVSEEEARALYDEQVAMMPDNEISFEEIREDLKQSLAQQQALFVLSTMSAELLEEADVETFY